MATYASSKYGVNSIPAAAVFAALYAPFFINFVYQSVRRPTPVFYSLSFFCLVRFASFIMRAILAGPGGNNVNLIIADQVLFSIGFFPLLYSAYMLVMDRELLSDYPPAGGIISRVIRRRRLFRVVLLIGIVIGVVGISLAEPSTSNSSSMISTGKILHQASTIIFLVLVVLLAYQTLILAEAELCGGGSGYAHKKASFGARHGIYILLVISLLLVIREAFTVATTNNPTTASNEHFWYPLVALPEILAVMLYSIPNFVPTNSEIRDRHMRGEAPGRIVRRLSTNATRAEPQTSEIPKL